MFGGFLHCGTGANVKQGGWTLNAAGTLAKQLIICLGNIWETRT